MTTYSSPWKLFILAACLGVGILWGSGAQASMLGQPAGAEGLRTAAGHGRHPADARRSARPAGKATCEDDCDDLSNDVYEACLAAGGAQADCQQEADQVLAVCIAQRCSVASPPMECADDCNQRGREILDLCLAAARPEDECKALADRFVAICASRICAQNLTPSPTDEPTDRPTDEPTATDEPTDVPTKEPTATDQPTATNSPTATDLPTATNPPTATDPPTATNEPTKAPTVKEPTPTEAPTSTNTPDACEDECARRGREFYEECVTGGNDPERCRVAAEQIVAACRQEPCGGTATPDTKPTTRPSLSPCEALCAARGRDFYNQCIAGGGNPEKCQLTADRLVADCRAQECKLPDATPTKLAAGGPTEAPVTACQQECADRGREYLRQCLADGGSEGQCRSKTQRLIEECTRKNCVGNSSGRTATPSSGKQDPGASGNEQACRQDCQRRGDAIYSRCIVTGGTDAVCRAQADSVVAQCVAEQCRIPSTRECQRRCNIAGQTAFSECMRSPGASIRACAAKAQVVVQRCLADCNGAPATSTPRSTKP